MNRLAKLGIISVGTLALIACSGIQPTVAGATEQNASVSASATVSDDGYVAYRNAHPDSPEIPAMIVTLARKHLNAGEYLLTRFYLNEYRRDYPSGKERAEIEYLAGEVRYRQYQAGHDDAAAEEAHQILRSVSRTFRHSPWAAKARTLSAKLREEQNRYYEKLAKYYEGKGKPKAAAIYRGKIGR